MSRIEFYFCLPFKNSFASTKSKRRRNNELEREGVALGSTNKVKNSSS